MALVELTQTQSLFLETWLDAILPDPDDADLDTIISQLDPDALDLPDLWIIARGRADAALAEFKAALEKEEDPNLQRIAQFGLLGVLGGNNIRITQALMAYGNAAPADRPARAQDLDAAFAALEDHLDTSPIVDLVEHNDFDIRVPIRAPLREGISAIRRRIAT